MIGADLDQQHELKHGILSSIFCILNPDLHLNCGSGSGLQNKCGSMQIRIQIHSPAYTFSKINKKKVEFFNALLTLLKGIMHIWVCYKFDGNGKTQQKVTIND